MRHLGGQPVETETHAHRTAGQVDLGAGRDLDHEAAFSTARTRRSARSLTKASTRSRTPSIRSISITPGRSSIPGRGTLPRCENPEPIASGRSPSIFAGTPPGSRATMPIGMNSGELPGAGGPAGGAIATDDVPSTAQADPAPAALFQVNTRLAF